METVAQNPSVTQKELASTLTLSEIGVRYHTNKLKAKGILKRIGGRKTGRWDVLK